MSILEDPGAYQDAVIQAQLRGVARNVYDILRMEEDIEVIQKTPSRPSFVNMLAFQDIPAQQYELYAKRMAPILVEAF